MTRVLVVETSYLCELYRVPRFSEPQFGNRLLARWSKEERAGARFHVPVGCVYQLCDHIADVPDGAVRFRLADKIATDVQSSTKRFLPWLVVPADGVAELARSVRAFASDAGHLKLGLTNAQVVEVAQDLKTKYSDMANYQVHIWTRNSSLKAYEPDREPDPLL